MHDYVITAEDALLLFYTGHGGGGGGWCESRRNSFSSVFSETCIYIYILYVYMLARVVAGKKKKKK